MALLAMHPPGPAGLRGMVLTTGSATAGRLLLGGAATLVAYHHSLTTLLGAVALDTPLAYLGLVPVLAVGLCLVQPPAAPAPDIHDRQLDFIVGLPAIAAALATLVIGPTEMGDQFWVDRLDLLSLPLFVGGLVALLFGTRTLAHLRKPIALLLLAWPQPYAWFLDHHVDQLTSATLKALGVVLRVVPVAHAQAGSDGVFTVSHGATSFDVSVASVCAGVNGVVGFTLVAVATMVLTRGPRWRRLVWVATGLLITFTLNLLRLVLVLGTGHLWGEHASLDGLHPVIGIVLFGAGVIASWLLLRPLGLTVAVAPGGTWRASLRERPSGASGLKVALVVIGLAVGLAAPANAALSRFELVAGDLGAARLASFQSAPPTLAGYLEQPVAAYDWVKRYFGSSSSWQRFQYSPTGSVAGGQVVLADVIDAGGLSGFRNYGVEACYAFHGYTVRGRHEVGLGGGVKALVLTYRNPHGSSWNVVSWVWPVTATAGHVRYERVTLLDSSDGAASPPGSPVSAPLKGVGYATAVGGAGDTATLAGQQALVTQARAIVSEAASVAGGKA